MPSRNIIKNYIPNYYYHLYTRGVNKRRIFNDEQDCAMFLRYLKLYLLPIEILKKLSITDIRVNKFIKNNLSNQVELTCFALMPNHFHLLVKLKEEKGIEKLMRRILTGYVMYFNQKYKRVGPLFQSRYKAAVVINDEYLTYLTRYIHRNPLKVKQLNPFEHTSYPYFIGEKRARWIHPDNILKYFSSNNPNLSYENFVEDGRYSSDLGGLALE